MLSSTSDVHPPKRFDQPTCEASPTEPILAPKSPPTSDVVAQEVVIFLHDDEFALRLRPAHLQYGTILLLAPSLETVIRGISEIVGS
eukprot:scaffold2769_cov156-Amphora_coffeaeformis.AAC.3